MKSNDQSDLQDDDNSTNNVDHDIIHAHISQK